MKSAMCRRDALKLFAGGALAIVTGAKFTESASAGRTWCKMDPLFDIGGSLFDVTISSDIAMLTSSTGPVHIVLTVPKGLPVKTILQDAGFGDGYEITVRESSRFRLGNDRIYLRVAVTTSADDADLPVVVGLASFDGKCGVDQHSVTGTANERIVWEGEIDNYTWPGGAKAAVRRLGK